MKKTQNIKCHRLSKTLFCRGGLNDIYHLRFGAKLQGGTNDFRKMAASLFVYTEIGRSISKIYER